MRFDEFAILKSIHGVLLLVGLTSDGQYLVCLERDRGQVIIFTIPDWHKTEKTFHISDFQQSLALSPNGKLLAYGDTSHSISIWDIDKEQYVTRFGKHDDRIFNLEFDPTGKFIKSATISDFCVRLWDVENGTPIRNLGRMLSSNIAFNRDGKTYLAGSSDGIRTHNIISGESTLIFPDEDGVQQVVLSSNSEMVAYETDGRIIKVWNRNSTEPPTVFKPPHYEVDDLLFSPNGKYLLCSNRVENFITIWEINSGEVVETFYPGSENIYALAFSPDGKYLVGGGQGWKSRLGHPAIEIWATGW